METAHAGGLIKRDSELWLLDGTVIIVAQDTAFRVYKRALIQRSEAFCKLFSSGRNTNIQIIDGCPVVRVSDSPEDIRPLLLLFCGKECVWMLDLDFVRLRGIF